MISRLHFQAILACAGLMVACSKEHGAGDGHDHGVTDQHAPAAVVPGSYEDWCGEHAVPESKCTRCDTNLAAAFKATGDWCQEHGLPETQCLKCDPSRQIVRPPKPAGQ